MALDHQLWLHLFGYSLKSSVNLLFLANIKFSQAALLKTSVK